MMSSPVSENRRVLLVAWDGAEWDLISPMLDAGELRSVGQLVEHGAFGRLATMAPIDPALLWTSAATGLPPEIHGVLASWEAAADGSRAQPSSPSSRLVPAVWDYVAKAGARAIVIGWPGTHPVGQTDGVVMVSPEFDANASGDAGAPWPFPEGAVFPADHAKDVAELRMHPGEFQTSDLAPLIPGIADIAVDRDARPSHLAASLARAISRNAVATYFLENEPWDFAAVYFPSLAESTRRFIRFHPPQLADATEADFQNYHAVIAGALRMHDQMLGHLLQMAGKDTTVVLVSASGFYTGHLRPVAREGEHAETGAVTRPAGFAVIAGPGVRRDELLLGAGLMELCHTVLWRMGIPLPAHLAADPWVSAWAEPPPVARESHGIALEMLADIPDLPDGSAREAIAIAQERRFHLAIRHMECGRWALALPLLERMCAERPERLGPALQLVSCLRQLGRPAAASALLEEIAARPEGGVRPREGKRARYTPGFDMMRGLLALDQGRLEEAKVCLARAVASHPQSAEMPTHLGRVLRALGERENAENAFRASLKIDPDFPEAHLELARLLYRTRRFADAATHAMEAAARRPLGAGAHIVLGLALQRTGETAQAITALRNALRHAPRSLFLHRTLRSLHARRGRESFSDAAAVKWHDDAIRSLRG